MFYGWRIVSVVFLMHFISVGLVFYSYSVLFKALAADFGGSRLGVAWGLAIMNVAVAAISPWLGRLVDRGSIRRVVCAGACLMAVGFLIASRIEALWQFYAVMGTLLALGSAMMGAIPGSTLVANWFNRRRGIALGIAGMGISLSGVAMAPAATLLIGSIGWRGTFVVYAGLTLVVIVPAVWLTIVDRPEDRGLKMDGAIDDVPAPAAGSAAGSTELVPPPEWSSRRILGDPNFWVIGLIIGLNFCANGAVLTHIVSYGTDIGLEPMAAALVLSTIAGFGVAGKVLFGWILDRIPKRIVPGIASGLQALGLVLILYVEEYPLLLVAGAVFGLGMGGLIPLWGALIGAGFGRQAFGRVMGLMSPVMLPVHVAGIPFAGWIFDRNQSYDVAFWSFLGVYGLAIAAVLLLRLPEVEPDAAPLSTSQ
jgi:MFS family permease